MTDSNELPNESQASLLQDNLSDEENIDVGVHDTENETSTLDPRPSQPQSSSNRRFSRKRSAQEELYEVEIEYKKRLNEKVRYETEDAKYSALLKKIQVYKELKALGEEEGNAALNMFLDY